MIVTIALALLITFIIVVPTAFLIKKFDRPIFQDKL